MIYNKEKELIESGIIFYVKKYCLIGREEVIDYYVKKRGNYKKEWGEEEKVYGLK